MAKQLQLRRGTTAQHATFTGAAGEVTIDTDKDVVVVHDGSTAGGKAMVKEADTAYTIATVDDFGTVPVGYTTVIVKDTDRGGVFNRIASTTANGGTIFDGTTGYSWERQYSGAVNVKWFGAKGDGVTDDTVAIQDAIDYLATINSYEKAKGLFFQGGTYVIASTLSVDVSHGSLTLYSDTKASLIANVSAGTYVIDVDYSTGATANFLTFNMTNIAITDAYTPTALDKKGIHMSRVIGSKFTQCEFNYLNIAVRMDYDSNLNTFDTCMWRGNISGWQGNIANNNLFLNCQWRYHNGTAFDATNTGGNIIDGGDFEPYNASPTIIASSLTMRNTRYERNVHGIMGIQVLSNNDLDVGCHSDGGTQVLPLFYVEGSHNKLKANGSGATACYFANGSTNNEIEVSQFTSLLASGGKIVDSAVAEPSNIIVSKFAKSNNSLKTMTNEITGVNLVNDDLTTWTKVNCNVVQNGDGYEIVSTAAGAYIYTTLTGTFENLYGTITSIVNNASGQPRLEIDSNVMPLNTWPSIQKRVVVTPHTTSFTNPVIKISLIAAGAGGGGSIYNVRIHEKEPI